MFTLLTQEKRQELLKRYRVRLALTVSIFLLILLLIGLVFLTPTYLAVKSEENTLTGIKANAKESIEGESNQDIQKTLADLKKDIDILKPEDTSVANIILLVTNSLSSGVKITNFYYSSGEKLADGEKGKSTLKIVGLANSRKTLIDFSKILETSDVFDDVDLPIGNLAKDSNINFSLTLTGNF